MIELKTYRIPTTGKTFSLAHVFIYNIKYKVNEER